MTMKQLFLFCIGRNIPIVLLCILTISIISIPVFAQQIQFGADPIGQNLITTGQTGATGTAKFSVDDHGNMAYEIDVKNINGVIGAHISFQNGTDLSQVFNPYAEINGKSEIPTGQINGQLSKGVITANHLSGPLIGKNITDLTNLMRNGSIFVVVRTQPHEDGEIQGIVTVTNSTGK